MPIRISLLPKHVSNTSYQINELYFCISSEIDYIALSSQAFHAPCISKIQLGHFFLWIFWASPKSLSIKRSDNPKYYQVDKRSCALPPPHMLCVDNTCVTYFYSFYQASTLISTTNTFDALFMVSCYLQLRCRQTLDNFFHAYSLNQINVVVSSSAAPRMIFFFNA